MRHLVGIIFPALITNGMLAVVIVIASRLLFVAVTRGTVHLLVKAASCASAENPGSCQRPENSLLLLGESNCTACDFSRGLSVVPDEEVIEMYEGSHVPLEQMSDFYGKVMRDFLFKAACFLLETWPGRFRVSECSCRADKGIWE